MTCYITCYVPRTPPPIFGSGSASLQCWFIQQLLLGLALIIGEGHATFRAGPIGGRGGAAVGGAWRRSCMNFFFFATRFTVFATFFKFSPHLPIFSPHPPIFSGGGVLCWPGGSGFEPNGLCRF